MPLGFLLAQYGFHHLFKYIEGLISTGLPSEMHQSFDFLQSILFELGLDIAQKHSYKYELLQKPTARKIDLQSLLRSLSYATKCVMHARSFLNRMLALQRQNWDFFQFFSRFYLI